MSTNKLQWRFDPNELHRDFCDVLLTSGGWTRGSSYSKTGRSGSGTAPPSQCPRYSPMPIACCPDVPWTCGGGSERSGACRTGFGSRWTGKSDKWLSGQNWQIWGLSWLQIFLRILSFLWDQLHLLGKVFWFAFWVCFPNRQMSIWNK